jgi:hypothetical protein
MVMMPGYPRIPGHFAGRHSFVGPPFCVFALLPKLLLSLTYYGHLTRSSFPTTSEYPRDGPLVIGVCPEKPYGDLMVLKARVC